MTSLLIVFSIMMLSGYTIRKHLDRPVLTWGLECILIGVVFFVAIYVFDAELYTFRYGVKPVLLENIGDKYFLCLASLLTGLVLTILSLALDPMLRRSKDSTEDEGTNNQGG